VFEIKDLTSSKEAENMYRAIEPRLEEYRDKLINGSYNSATWLAFEIGFISDIDKVLKVMKVKRTPIKKKNVKELEVKDVDGEIELIER